MVRLIILSLIIGAGVHVLPVAELLYAFPLTHSFRFHSRIYFVSSMAIIVLFAYALDYILKQDKHSIRQEIGKILKLGTFIALVTFIFLGGLIAYIHFFYEIANKIDTQFINEQSLPTFLKYYQLNNIGLFLPFIVFLLGRLLLWLLPLVKKRALILCGLWLVFVFDLWLVSSSYTFSLQSDYPHPDLISKIKPLLQPTDRILISAAKESYPDNISYNSSVLYNIQSLDGFVNFSERNIAPLNKGMISLEQLKGMPLFLETLQNKNGFLSMLGLKYFVIDKEYSNDVENPHQAPLGNWRLMSQLAIQEMDVAPGYTRVFSKKIKLNPKWYYKVKLTVENDINGLLYVDFYGLNYDNAEQKLDFGVDPSKKRRFSGVIYTGNSIPADVYLRIVTQDQMLKLKTIQIYASPPALAPSVYKKVFTTDNFVVYENPNAKSRIYSVSDVRWENDSEYNEINLLNTAIVDKKVQNLAGLGIATVDQMAYGAGDIKAKIQCPAAKCFVVLSEAYFPGWKIYVDGKKDTLYKVNDFIQGTLVQHGTHWVQFHYFPNSFIIGLGLFIFGLIWVPVWLVFPRPQHPHWNPNKSKDE